MSVEQILDDATKGVVSELTAPLSGARSQNDAPEVGEHGTAVEAKIVQIKGWLEHKEHYEALAVEGTRQLHDEYGCRTAWIAKRLGLAESTISGYIAAARAFPPGTMRPDVPLYRHQAVAQSIASVTKRAAKTHGITVKLDPQKVMDLAIANDLKKPQEMVSFLRTQLRKELSIDNRETNIAKSVQADAHSPDIICRCHHLDYRDLIPKFHPKSIQIIHIDAPYSDYAHGSCLNSDMAGITECDNDSEADALQVTCDAFQPAEKALAQNGVILLWQSCNPLRPAIQDAIDRAGLVCNIPVVWNKIRTQPGAPEGPWTQQWEALYIIRRKNDTLANYDGSARGNIITFQPVQHSRSSLNLTHSYQKPEDLCAFLVGKHSQEGHIVADLFGCSGAFCIAAQKMGRRWIYCESNATNFNFGAARIANAIDAGAAGNADDGAEEVIIDDTIPAETGVIAA